MKRFKRSISMILAVLLTAALCAVPAAANGETKTVKMLCYNVAGLPSINGVMGQQGSDVPANQSALGRILNRSDYDVIAVQEDFGYHCLLSSGMTNYRYKTIHSGGIPGGDGLNIFSKVPIYNAKRTKWEKAYGVINDGADELTPKGILYAVLKLGDGIYVDFYDIHADAFGDAGSVAARDDNFRQLAAMILSRNSERPVIVTGDFNTSAHREDGKRFLKYMIDTCEMKDAWTELYNGGSYTDYSGFSGESSGKWDSIEKFLYKDGGGITVEPTAFSYVDFTNGGVSISDHKAASVSFRFEKTDGFVHNTDRMRVTVPSLLGAVSNKISVTVTDLVKIFIHRDELLELLR